MLRNENKNLPRRFQHILLGWDNMPGMGDQYHRNVGEAEPAIAYNEATTWHGNNRALHAWVCVKEIYFVLV